MFGVLGQSQGGPERGALACREAVQVTEHRAEQLVQTGEREERLGLAAHRPQYPMAGTACPPYGEVEQDALAGAGVAFDDQHGAGGPVGGDATPDLRDLGLPAHHGRTEVCGRAAARSSAFTILHGCSRN